MDKLIVAMKISRLLPIIALSACSTSPVPLSEAKPLPLDRLLGFQQPVDPGAVLVVTRDSGYQGGGCYAAFFIDGVLAGRFASSESAQFLIAPGEHVLRGSVDPQGAGLCGLVKDHWTQVETTLKAGEKKHFRLGLDASGTVKVERSDP